MNTKLYALLITFTIPFYSNSQLLVNAGPDVHVCNSGWFFDTTYIGTNLTIQNGTPPYSFTWETKRVYHYHFGDVTYYASTYLDDTTATNPKIIKEGDTTKYKVTITDSTGQSASDSIYVIYSNWGTHTGYLHYSINHGDSVLLFGMQNLYHAGGLPNNFVWRPNHGLKDSTSLTFWAKPNFSVAYTITATDENGCTATATAPAYIVDVGYMGKNEHKIDKNIVWYDDGVLYIDMNGSNSEGELLIHDLNGRIVFRSFLHQAKSKYQITLVSGVYIYTLLGTTEPISNKLIVQ